MLKIFDYPVFGKTGTNEPFFTAYLLDPAVDFPQRYEEKVCNPRPAMVVFPGGGYSHLSPRESEPIALAYAAKGFNTFVLNYSLYPKLYPQPLYDAAMTLNIIRDHAEEWNVDPDRIAICGFSAGGHLAGALAANWNAPELAEAGIDNAKARPNAAVLSYAAVGTGRGELFQRFADFFLGSNVEDPKALKLAEIYRNVSEETCPCFLWQTSNDTVVDVENSLQMASALHASKVLFEMHIFPDGPHGMALANELTTYAKAEHPEDYNHPDAAQWIPLSIDWLNRTWKLDL